MHVSDGKWAVEQMAARLKGHEATRLEGRSGHGIGRHKAARGVWKRCKSDTRPSGAE